MVEARKIAFISSSLPRQCGIATFSSDLIASASCAARGRMVAEIVAMESTDHLRYGDQVRITVRKDHRKDYPPAAEHINYSGVHLVSLQHEFGLFGGEAGRYILLLLERLTVPVVTTCHTVLDAPPQAYRDTLAAIARCSRKVVVMNHRGIDMLTDIYGVARRKIVFLPHGLPDLPFVDSTPYKERLRFQGRTIVLSFGLLSRNKGIEVAIRAMSEVVKAHPELTYVILGVTHPEVQRSDGEAYRFSLERLVQDLELERNVVFINRFVDDATLHLYLNAADFYLTPYLSREQLTSGTLAFALGTGKAVISTPYWHAEELLADERGVLVPFADAGAISAALLRLLASPRDCARMRRRAYDFSRNATWPHTGEAYWKLFVRCMRPRRGVSAVPKRRLKSHFSLTGLPEFRLDHFLRITDDTGILQHALGVIPDRRHGYCTDDNARALEVMVRLHHQRPDDTVLRLLGLYLSFLLYAQQADGSFHNFMSYDRRFLHPDTPGDASARSLSALGRLISSPPTPVVRAIARECFDKAVVQARGFSVRGQAYAICGLAAYLNAFPDDQAKRDEMARAADVLVAQFKRHASPGWQWFEDSLTYDNGVLPHALFVAHGALHASAALETAKASARFLIDNTFNGDYFSFIGCHGWYPRGGERARYDQQPIDAMSTVRMLRAAFEATGDEAYLVWQRKAFNWFLGANDQGLPLFDFATQGCSDGLGSNGMNFNQGAESLVSYTLARYSIASAKGGEALELLCRDSKVKK